MFRAPILVCATALAVIASPIAAQTADADAQRQAVFQQMLADPSNRQVMGEYARLSVQVRDFEAAAATLERLVDLEPNNTPARVELAIAYFALGSYAVAQYHLAAAQASGALSPEQAAQVARYSEEARDRGDLSDYGGRLEVGYAFADTTGEQGAFINGSIDWRYDLGGADATQWVTEFAFSTYRPGDRSINERSSGRLRTGPEWRLARDAYGPRLHAYAELGWFENDDVLPGDFRSLGVGLAYATPLDERFTVYADVAVGRDMAVNDADADFSFHDVDLGVTYRPSRDTRVRLSGTWGARDILDDPASFDVTQAAIRLSAQHAFDVGWSTLPHRWVAGAFAEMGRTELNDAGTLTQFDEQSYGMWLRAFVFEDIYLETAAAWVTEDATGGITATREEAIYTVQIGWEF